MQENRIKEQLDTKNERSRPTRISINKSKKSEDNLEHVINNEKNGIFIIAATLTWSSK